jgi:hypothetical protein
MKAEEIAKEAQLAVRIIPTPEKIHASCGFSLKYPLKEEEALMMIRTASWASFAISSAFMASRVE